MRKRAVVTGIGVIAPNGIGKNEFWENLLVGKSGIKKIISFDTATCETKIAGEITNFVPTEFMDEKVAKSCDRFTQFGIAATKLALEDSGLNLTKEDPYRVAVIIGSGIGGMMFYEKQVRIFLEHNNNCQKVHPSAVEKITPNAVSGQIAMQFNCQGVNLTISTACSSSSHAIGQAIELIRTNKADVVIAGGVEAPLVPVNFASFNNMRIMSKYNENPEEACKPFDLRRDGFVMGEGSGILILESYAHATKRNANCYGEIVGYGANSGAYHMVKSRIDGIDASMTMFLALDDARINPTQIDYINAHGTATVINDIAETNAIKKVFLNSAYKIPISSTKAVTGHLIGAAGAIETIVCLMVINDSKIPPTRNYKVKDPKCDLDYVPNEPREREVRYAMSNSFGFGSNNSTIIVKKI